MSELQKYYTKEHHELDHYCSISTPLSPGCTAVYLASEIDAALAAIRAEKAAVEDRCNRLDAEIERYKRAVECCLENGAQRESGGIAAYTEVPPDLADIISPAAAVGQEGRE